MENNGGGVSNEFMDAVLSGDFSAVEQRQAAAPANEPAPANPEPSTPPAATTPAAPTETNTNPEPATGEGQQGGDKTVSAPDPNDVIAKISNGGIKSVDELNTILADRQRLTDLESRLATYEAENTSLKAKVNTSPFATPFLEKLNKLHTEGASEEQIQAFTALNKAGDLSQLDPLEARKLELQLRNGLTAEEAETYLDATYGLNDEEADEVKIAQGKVKLKVDAKASVEYLKGHLADISEGPRAVEQRNLQAEKDAYIEKAKPVIQHIVRDLSAIKGVSLNGKTGDEAISTDLPVSDESKAILDQAIQQYATANNIPLNEEGIKHLNQFAENILVQANWRNWAVDIAAKTEERIRAEFHNPAAIQRPEDKKGAPVNDLSKQMEWVAQNAS